MKTIFSFFILFISTPLRAENFEPYTVYLKEGAVLTSLSDKSTTILLNGIYAKVLELNPQRRDLFNVFDKNGVAQYQVTPEGIVEIEEDIKILPNINAQKSYPPKNSFKAENSVALLDTQLSFHFDNLNVSNLNTIYNDRASIVLATRSEVRALYVSSLPIEFGLVLNYQSAHWESVNEKIALSILSLGPQFKYRVYQIEDFNIFTLFDAEIAPLYQATTSLYTDKFSATLLDIGIENEWHNSLGTFSFGTHYRRHEIALSRSNRPDLTLLPKEFSLSSLGFMIGYKIEWNL